ncbi:hypothetical protein JHW43_005735 [Diplocarpon mali]|nr:hypothetical protein JHW43_005735 [Diplocarpon mali]
MFRERIFCMAIKKIELRDGKTLVYDDKGRDADRRDLEQWCENEERLVFLARFACSDSVSWMFGVVEYVLQGTVSEIREVVIVPKNPTRRLPTVCTNGEENPSASMAHQLFRLKLSGIHDFALDLSGAQNSHLPAQSKESRVSGAMLPAIKEWEERMETGGEQVLRRLLTAETAKRDNVKAEVINVVGDAMKKELCAVEAKVSSRK